LVFCTPIDGADGVFSLTEFLAALALMAGGQMEQAASQEETAADAEATATVEVGDSEFFSALDGEPPAEPADPPPSDLPPTESELVGPPTPPAKPAAPKKKKPPAFPGPKTLPPTGPYKPLFFDNEFFTDGSTDHQLFNCNDWLIVNSGGELRHRYMNQDNRLQPGGPGRDTYQLWRWRHFLDVRAGENFRAYVEGIDASSFGQDLPVQPIDVNRWDLLNAFVDVELFETGSGTQTLRYGRQELLFGRQRLVSPLDWANTRRNFEGFRYMIKEQDWKMDIFSVNPVNSATGFRSVAEFDNRFDQPNRDVFFSGAYYTYTGLKNTNIELYYLWLDDSNPTVGKADGNRHTVGSRYTKLIPVDAESRVWDYDVEAAYQFGNDNGLDVQAGFATAIAGHTWKKAPWTPRLSGLFYYGSGDVNAGDGTTNTFSTLFPLGHAYWGLSDNLTGQNLYDWSLQVDVKPTDKTAVTVAHHFFNLASGNDVVYNVGGNPVGTPGNGVSLGNALDLYGYYSFNEFFDVQLGYSWFWYGNYIDRTTPRGDATQFYVQTTYRY
jgi:hypothetical protein